MKKFIALAVVVSFASVYSVAPVFAGGGPAVAKEKNPKTAALLSAILPPAGQVYNGEWKTLKAAAMAAIEGGSIFVLVFFLARDDSKYIAFAGGGGMLANRVWSTWDAYRSAQRINQGLALNMDKDRVMVSYNIPF